jgi:hypothetical protein
MDILIVSNSYHPLISPRSFRTTELTKELLRQGHRVKVIIPNLKQDYEGLPLEYPGLQIEQQNVFTWKEIKQNKSSLAGRLLWKFRWLLVIYFEYPSIQWWLKMPRILKKERDYDLLISIAVPHPIHWGIARCFRKKMPVAKKWIADCGDPYMGVKTSLYKHPFYFKYFEKSFCKRADFITIPIDSGKSAYYEEFHSKIRVIPQGFNFEEVERLPYLKSEKVRFCYAGAFYTKFRDPRPLMEVLLETNIDFEFTVFTTQASTLAEYKNKLGKKLIIKEYIPRKELITFMSSMDFLVNLQNGTIAQIPSKLIDYALSGRPIVSLDSQNFEKGKVSDFLKGDYSRQFKIENMEDYNIKNVAKAFTELAN